MSIRNLTIENNINIECNDIKCNEIIGNNLYSKIKNVQILSPLDDFDVETVNPTAIFTRTGDYILCSGKARITITTEVTVLQLDIKILEFDEPYNSISDDVQVIGGCGSGVSGGLALYYLEFDTLSSVSSRYRHLDGTPLSINTEWLINYSFIFKQTTF